MAPLGTVRRLRLLRGAIGVAFLSGMVVAPGLWESDRPFPTLPAFSWLPELPPPIAKTLALGLVLSLLGTAFRPRPGRLVGLAIVLWAVSALFDMSRLQPWAYEYMLMLAALALAREDDESAPRNEAILSACGAVVALFYLWSGLQKANPIFATQVFPWLLHPLGGATATRLQPLWPIAPLTETAIGLLLLVPRTRPWGVGLAVAMNLLILVALGPFGQNYDPIVWPWNFWLAIIAGILFVRNDRPLLRPAWNAPVGKALLLLVGVLPAFSFVGLWDGFLSASYYSGKLRDGWIYFTAEGFRHLPAAYVQGNQGLVEESPDRYRMDILGWAMSRLNAPPYGEPRFYPEIVRKLEAEGVPASSMLLVVQDPARLTSAERPVSTVRLPW